MPEAVCPLCRSAALVVSLDNSGWRYTCPTCGTFELWDFATEMFGTQEHWDETRLQLSKVARKASDEGHPLKLRDEESLHEAITTRHVGASQ
jgi:transposase-like protein